jgi:hypothetical protein
VIYVEFYALEGSPPRDAMIAWLGWDGSRFVLSDPGSVLLNNVLTCAIRDRRTGETVTPDTPERWLALLSHRYTSAYLRASAPKPIAPAE